MGQREVDLKSFGRSWGLNPDDPQCRRAADGAEHGRKDLARQIDALQPDKMKYNPMRDSLIAIDDLCQALLQDPATAAPEPKEGWIREGESMLAAAQLAKLARQAPSAPEPWDGQRLAGALPKPTPAAPERSYAIPSYVDHPLGRPLPEPAAPEPLPMSLLAVEASARNNERAAIVKYGRQFQSEAVSAFLDLIESGEHHK